MKIPRPLHAALATLMLSLALTSTPPARAADAKPAPAAATPAATAGTTATFWGQAAWILTTPQGATIAIDPWLDNPIAPKLEQPNRSTPSS